jgi:carbon monoxide dehydrogenase subunit G
MVHFSQSATIHAPVEKVFAYVADPARIPEWRKDVPGISAISGAPGRDITFLEGVNFMGKKSDLRMRIADYDPNTKLTIKAESGMKLLPTQSFLFTPVGEDTRIDLSVDMQVSGFFRLMAFMLPGQLKKIWSGYFKNLDERLKG